MATKTKAKDKYSRALDYFRKYPQKMIFAWLSPTTKKHGCLFFFASPNGDQTHGNGTLGDNRACGCLTMIRSCPEGYTVYGHPELAKEIAADENVPKSIAENVPWSKIVHLAKWQRRLDKVLGRV